MVENKGNSTLRKFAQAFGFMYEMKVSSIGEKSQIKMVGSS